MLKVKCVLLRISGIQKNKHDSSIAKVGALCTRVYEPFKRYNHKYTKFKDIQIADVKGIFLQWYKRYQDFVGITAILEAQSRVTTLTNELFEVQSERRELHKEVEIVHLKLLDTHQKITKSELYSEDHFALFEKARQLNSALKSLQSEFSSKENYERLLFTQLSSAIKFCHDKERTHSDQSKYWSIIISVISLAVGAFVTSLNNWLRIQSIKEHSSQLHNNLSTKFDKYISNISDLKDNDKAKYAQEGFLQSIQSVFQIELQNAVQDLRSSKFTHNQNIDAQCTPQKDCQDQNYSYWTSWHSVSGMALLSVVMYLIFI